MTKIISGFLIILLLGVVIACQQIAIPHSPNPMSGNEQIVASLDNPFSLNVQGVGGIPSENLRIQAIEIVEDSRCPANVQCVWSGQVTVAVSAIANEQNWGNFNLTLGQDDSKAVRSLNGYTLQLLKVRPYPQTSEKLEISEYRVTFLVSRQQ